jgi:hypothetical protein
VATRQRTRTPRDPETRISKALLESEPPPPVDVKFSGERVPQRERSEQIAEAAYLRAERRGFAPGLELQDWLEAEREIDALLSARDSERR